MHPVRNGRDQVAQEVASDATGGCLVQFRKGKLTRAVDGHEEVELALLSPHLGEVDVEVADRIRLDAKPRTQVEERARESEARLEVGHARPQLWDQDGPDDG